MIYMSSLKKLVLKLTNKKSIDQINKNIAILTVDSLLKNQKYAGEKNLLKHGYKVFSQQDEDGIIDEIFNRIGTKSKKFIEIGVETGIECNTTNLLYQKWSGLWLESDKDYEVKIKENFSSFLETQLKVHSEKINPTNVNQIFSKYYEKDSEIDLLSIDIGVHTYHVLEAINVVNPRVIITEYNAKYGPVLEWKLNYDQNEEWDFTDHYGASLYAFEKMLRNKSYELVGCNITGANAFFIRKNEIGLKFEENSSSKYHFIDGRYWLKNAFSKDYKVKIK